MTYEDQIYALKTAEFAADGDECVRRDDALRIARAADAEVAKLSKAEEACRLDLLAKIKEANLLDVKADKLQSGIVALHKKWQAQHDAWQWHLDHISEDTAFVDGQLQAIKAILQDLNALLPARDPQ